MVMLVAQVEARPPDTMRALALFIATYVDRWPALAAMHQAVLAQFPATSEEAKLTQAIAPRLQAHLEQQERQATAQQDLLHHAVVQPALEQLRVRTEGDATDWHAFWQRLQNATGEVRPVLEARYGLQLRGEALAAHLQVVVADLPLLLCRTRSQVDWLTSPGAWTSGANERMLPELIEEYVSDSIDPDSRQLLGASLNRDLTSLARFQRQVRLHLLLSAAFVRLPFAPTRTTTDNGSNRVIVLPDAAPAPRPSARKVSSGDRVVPHPAREPRSQHLSVTWMVAGGCLLLAALLVVMLNRSDTTVVSPTSLPAVQPATGSPSAPRPVEANTTGTPSPSAPTSVPSLPPAAARDAVVALSGMNLLNHIDLKRDALAGGWQLNGGTLRVDTDKNTNARLQIPVTRAAEYDFRVVFTRVERQGAITLMAFHGNEAFATSIASHGNRLAGFSRVKGMQLDVNPTCKDISGLVINGKRLTALLEVRRTEVRLSLNGTIISTWTPALGALSANPTWALRDQSALGLGCYSGIVDFHEVVYTPRDQSGISTMKSTATPPKPAVVEDPRLLHAWDFSRESIGIWQAIKGVTALEVRNGALTGTVNDADAFIEARGLRIAIPVPAVVEVRLRATRSGGTQLYFNTDLSPKLEMGGTLNTPASEQFTTHVFDLSERATFRGKLTVLRLDVVNGSATPAQFAIASVRILRK
jgi:hypothetical protein